MVGGVALQHQFIAVQFCSSAKGYFCDGVREIMVVVSTVIAFDDSCFGLRLTDNESSRMSYWPGAIPCHQEQYLDRLANGLTVV